MEERRFHSDSRTRENFTEDGLTSLTGQPSHRWGRYVVKELVDNALEAAESVADPAVTVRLWTGGPPTRRSVQAVEVEDNGPGIGAGTLERIADTDAFGGTKRHYALPTRGTQGNALMTIVGIQYLAAESSARSGPLRMRTRGTEYTLPVQESTLEGVPSVQLREEGTTGVEGTAVRVEFGRKAGQWASADPIYRTLWGFGALNPHVRLVVETRDPDGEGDPVRTTFEAGAESPTRYTPKGNATSGRATWYAPQAFAERLKADIRAAPSLPVGRFVSEFDGLSSRAKREAVLEEIPAPGSAPIEKVFGENGTFDSTAAEAVREAMQAETRPRSAAGLPSTLGSVGEALQGGARSYLSNRRDVDLSGLVERLRAEGAGVEGWTDLALYYRDSGIDERSGTEGARTPFVFELAAIPFPDTATFYEGNTTHLFGINGSVAYSAPKIGLDVEHHSKEPTRHRTIQGAFDGLKHNFAVVTNLTCPNISFEDKGKQQFDTGPFEGAISAVVGKAVRKYERYLRPALNKLEPDRGTAEPPPLKHKAPKGYIKGAVFDLFPEVYDRATEGGEFTITMRQLFYKMRPAFQRRAKQDGYKWTCSSTPRDRTELSLNYDTFTGYVDEYEQDVLGGRVVYRKERGFFVEPHSGRRIELSTRKVQQYDPAPAVRKECSTLLYVEKTGFYEQLHKDFQITKRFDVGLICAEGFATGAARDLVEKLQTAAEDGSMRLLVLTDLDAKGLGIAEDASRADALSELDVFETERIGVELGDVERYGLPVESASYNQATETALRGRHERGEVPTDTFEFLMGSGGQRVEINAFSPSELRGYVEDKLKAAGVEKIVPGTEDVETPDVEGWERVRRKAIREAIGRYVQEQIGGDLIERLIQACGDEARIPAEEDRPALGAGAEEIRERVRERLEEQPPKPWTEINEAVVNDLTEEVDAAQSEFQEAVTDAVLSRLSETDFVTVGSS